jgi:hypothetical protein
VTRTCQCLRAVNRSTIVLLVVASEKLVEL